MPREKLKWPKLRGESTEARSRGGPTRTSGEGPVIGLEQRGRVRTIVIDVPTGNRMTTTITTNKPFHIDKKRVYEPYKAVKSNAGSAGVDGQTIEQFDSDLQNNLYKLWNRMSSGSYFHHRCAPSRSPKRLEASGFVPTVADRMAQMVVKQLIEPDLDPIFLANSYGYRPRKSALDAIGVTRKRCWKYDWVLEFDIKGLLDVAS